jgi:hypothetical protein
LRHDSGLDAPRGPFPYAPNDSHFHLTNYIQEGTDIHKFLEIMGDKVGRVALFGIPLQQQWSNNNDGTRKPAYYLESDSPLYYYSFTDASIAMAFKSLTKEQQMRFDPMITGFNPADMYATDHIRRVLKTFPGVFTGIGEFSIHKEFVSAKIAGEVASLDNKALDSAPGLLRRKLPAGHHPQRHGYTLCQSGQRTGVSGPDETADQAASQNNHYLGTRQVVEPAHEEFAVQREAVILQASIKSGHLGIHRIHRNAWTEEVGSEDDRPIREPYLGVIKRLSVRLLLRGFMASSEMCRYAPTAANTG